MRLYLNQAITPENNQSFSRFTANSQISVQATTTALSIDKYYCRCHPEICVKRISRSRSLVYTSSILLRLRQGYPSGADSAPPLETTAQWLGGRLNRLQTDPGALPVELCVPLIQEFSVQLCPSGLMSFELSNRGVGLWLQHLNRADLNPQAAPPAAPAPWPVQHAYARCAALLRHQTSQQGAALDLPVWSATEAQLIGAIADGTDQWEAGSDQAAQLSQAERLAIAFEQFHRTQPLCQMGLGGWMLVRAVRVTLRGLTQGLQLLEAL